MPPEPPSGPGGAKGGPENRWILEARNSGRGGVFLKRERQKFDDGVGETQIAKVKNVHRFGKSPWETLTQNAEVVVQPKAK